MSAREREVKVTVLGDASSGQRALRSLDDDAERTGNRFDAVGTKLATFGKVAALGLGAAVVGVGAFLKSSADAAEESRKVMAQTDAAIKSTGGAAKVTAQDINSLADELAGLTGVDDEVIASGANVLLTFTNIRNEVGKGNNIFDQATKSALNMSVAMGTDLSSASMLVGKALNDPIAGMTALTRSGVQFTAQQKDQIKAMVAAGDTLGAQKVILKELETQFGGSAEAAASPMARLKVVVGNLQEELGARLLPVIGRVATFLANTLPPALDAAGRFLTPLVAKFQSVVSTLRAELMPIVMVVAEFVRGNLVPILGALGAVLGGLVLAAVIALGTAIAGLFSPFVLIVAAVAGLVAGLIYAYQHFEGFRTVVDGVAQFLVGTVLPAIGSFAGFIVEKFGELVGWVQQHWGAIQEAIGHVISVVQSVIETFVGVVQAVWQAWGDEILNIARIVWDQIRNVVETVVNLVRGIIEVGLAVINGEWGAAWNGIKDILATAWDFIYETVVNALRLLREAVEGGLSAVVGLVGDLPGRVLGALGDLTGWLWDAGADLIWGMMEGIGSMAGRLAQKAVDVAKAAVDRLKGFLGIDSPSKVFMGFGVNVGEGFVEGMKRSEPKAGLAAASLAGTAVKAATEVIDASEYDSWKASNENGGNPSGIGAADFSRNSLNDPNRGRAGWSQDFDGRWVAEGTTKWPGGVPTASTATTGTTLVLGPGSIVVYALDPAQAGHQVREQLLAIGQHMPAEQLLGVA